MIGRIDSFVWKRLVPTLFGRAAMQPVNNVLFRVAMSGMGVNNYHPEMADERRFLERLARHLPVDSLILDVGANRGQYAALARAAFPRARIISFEPNPEAFSALRERAAGLDVEAVPLGCGRSPGEALLFDCGGGSPLATLVPDVHADAVETTVELTSIDDFCAERGIASIDLLKIDVEGAEHAVLEGAQRMLAARSVRVVQFEMNAMTLDAGTPLGRIEQLLRGYALFRILPSGQLLRLDGRESFFKNLYSYQNLVAIRATGEDQTISRK